VCVLVRYLTGYQKTIEGRHSTCEQTCGENQGRRTASKLYDNPAGSVVSRIYVLQHLESLDSMGKYNSQAMVLW